MLKVYINPNGIRMVGKARDICAKLKEYRLNYKTIAELTQKNQISTGKSSYNIKHDENSFTIITSTHKTPKLTNYYLLFPPKK